LINISKLEKENSEECFQLINDDSKDKNYFKSLGWSKNQFILQFNKNTNYSVGLYDSNQLVSFVVGELIFVEKVSEYEILIIYVKKTYRKKGLASLLLNNISDKKNKLKLNTMSLEVAENNFPAIEMYKKNNFNLIGRRKKYYLMNDEKIDALIFKKKL
tara:strand:- start:1764 stop:2240 length:477 start_codon:yes stop_codon:yes gene_type:complete